MNEITDAFLKTVSDRVDDCSTVGQMRECMAMYREVLYSTKVRLLFLERLEFLRTKMDDKFYQNACDFMEEELEGYNEIIRRHLEEEGLSFTVVFNAPEGQILDKGITALICTVLDMSAGKKKEAARLLGISQDELGRLIEDVSDRRIFFRALRKKLRPVDD